jgi:predicted nucleotidyltransferase
MLFQVLKILQVGAVKILNSLGCNTFLSFGSECGDVATLKKFAEILLKEPPEYVTMLNHELAKGLSFPKARENALLLYINDIRNSASVLSGSNNILGIEYLKQIIQTGNNITPITIKRVGSEYNSLIASNNIASATAIRDMLLNKQSVKHLMPISSYSILKNELGSGRFVLSLAQFEKEIIYKLRMMSIEQIANLPDVSEGLEYKIKEAANTCNDLENLMFMIKSKRYTLTRINRILLYALLDITKLDYTNSQKVIPYTRVLGVSNNGKNLLSELSRNKKINVITSVKQFMENSKNNSNMRILKSILQKDILATNIYTLEYKTASNANLDYTQKLITS